jgi:cellulose biosynthesis protein BcsQ
MNDKRLLTVSFVSGKGGVGKTMLAVAFAKELSRKNKTLIIDLDFFNRGLTGLFREKETVKPVAKPDFLVKDEEDSKGVDEGWTLCKVADNLYTIHYPDLHTLEIEKFQSLEIDLLRKSIGQFVREAAIAGGCTCVVLDCHGGPDNSSFAAAFISDHTLLISEPDRITYFGTLNFLRQLMDAHKSSAEQLKFNLHLVFNKVVPSFSTMFLRSFYDKHLKQTFFGNPLLAVFPLEVYLTKEFEKSTFLTSVFPYSLLARKTNIMIHDLLYEKLPERIPQATAALPKFLKWFARSSSGKPFFLTNLNVIVPVVFAGFMIFILTDTLAEKFSKIFPLSLYDGFFYNFIASSNKFFNQYGEHLGITAFAWTMSAFAVGWTKQLDIKFTYNMQNRKTHYGIFFLLILAGIWILPLMGVGFGVSSISEAWYLLQSEQLTTFDRWEIREAVNNIIGVTVLLLVYCWVLVVQGMKTYWESKYHKLYFEAIMRAVFILYLVGMPNIIKNITE